MEGWAWRPRATGARSGEHRLPGGRAGSGTRISPRRARPSGEHYGNEVKPSSVPASRHTSANGGNRHGGTMRNAPGEKEERVRRADRVRDNGGKCDGCPRLGRRRTSICTCSLWLPREIMERYSMRAICFTRDKLLSISNVADGYKSPNG